MCKNGKLIGIIAGLLAFGSSAFAGGYHEQSVKDYASVEPRWGGLYIGASVGYGSVDADLEYSASGPGSSTYGLDPDGVTGTVAIGYDRGWNGIVAGIFADYTFGNLDAKVSLPGPNSNLTLTYDRSWAIGARLGFVEGTRLWYLTAGYTGTEVEFEQFDETLHGYFIGGGVEQKLRENWSLKLEYRFSDYGDKSLYSGSGYGEVCSCQVDLDLDSHSHAIRLGIVYTFGNRGYEYAPLK